MILYRYMCFDELRKYISGQTLHNNIDHAENYITTSKGFCFLGEETTFISYNGEMHTYSPTDCLDFLSGIVSEDIIACFDIPDDMISESNGTYADPFGGDKCITIIEYNVDFYNKQKCKLLKIAIPVYSAGYKFDWRYLSN